MVLKVSADVARMVYDFDAQAFQFRRIADATDLPIIVFQYPLATG